MLHLHHDTRTTREGRTRPGAARRVSRVLLAMICVALSAACAVGVGGCKYSDVLTEHIEDVDRGTLDPDIEPNYAENPSAPPDPTRMSSEISDSDRIDDQNASLPSYDESAPASDDTEQREQDEQSNDDENASQGDEQSDENPDETTTGQGDPDDSTSSGTNDEPTGGEEEQPQETSAGGGGTGTIYDANTTPNELPENTQTIAAVGQYATIVQMLAGPGSLVATDQAWKDRVSSLGVFPGEGVESVPVAWTGDSDTGYTCDIDALIASAPGAVLVDGVSVSFPDEEAARLSEALIDVIYVPALGSGDTADADIVQAVQIVGELLRNSSQTTYNAPEAATRYVTMHDETIDWCLDQNAGYSYKMVNGHTYTSIYQDGGGDVSTQLSEMRYTTAYIDSWTSVVNSVTTAVRSYGNASLYLDGEQVYASGVGLSDSSADGGYLLLDYYLQVSGVVNNSYPDEKPIASSQEEGLPYVVIAGDPRDIVGSLFSFNQRAVPSALWYAMNSVDSGTNWTTLGDSTFPRLLVRDTEIASNVVESANNPIGLYNVGRPYEVRVVPSGLDGSWIDGTVESYLLSAWTISLYRNSGDLSFADEYVNAFYETFYRCATGTGTQFVENYDTSFQATCPQA